MSLPGIAQNIAFKMYEPDAYPIYSFGANFAFLNEEIRSSLFGGMTMVLHRLSKVKPLGYKPEEMVFPRSAYTTPDGSIIKKIQFWDFNSLVRLIE